MKEFIKKQAQDFAEKLINACCVVLSTEGNPDKKQKTNESLPGVPDKLSQVFTYRDASKTVLNYIEEYDIGGGNFTGGQIISPEGKIVAYVSYNGRVWKGSHDNIADYKNTVKNLDDNIIEDLAKKKVAKLVYVSFLTRVIVNEDASDEEIFEAARPELKKKAAEEMFENLEKIKDDTECPYDPETDK